MVAQILGLSGFARSGKDTVAQILVEEFGFKRVAFADKLREVLEALNPLVWGYPNPLYPDSKVADPHVMNLDKVLHAYGGWEGYKDSPYAIEIRRLLQRLGTEAGRQTLWDTIWIDAAFANQPEDAKIVVSDARFINEFDAIKQRGGKIWRIERPGVGPANDHPSETEAIDYPFSTFLNNDGSIEDLKEMVHWAIS